MGCGIWDWGAVGENLSLTLALGIERFKNLFGGVNGSCPNSRAPRITHCCPLVPCCLPQPQPPPAGPGLSLNGPLCLPGPTLAEHRATQNDDEMMRDESPRAGGEGRE